MPIYADSSANLIHNETILKNNITWNDGNWYEFDNFNYQGTVGNLSNVHYGYHAQISFQTSAGSSGYVTYVTIAPFFPDNINTSQVYWGGFCSSHYGANTSVGHLNFNVCHHVTPTTAVDIRAKLDGDTAYSGNAANGYLNLYLYVGDAPAAGSSIIYKVWKA